MSGSHSSHHPANGAGKRTWGNRLAPLRFLLFAASFIGFSALAFWSIAPRLPLALMEGFDGAALLFLLSLVPLVRGAGPQEIARHAAQNDANRGLSLLLSTIVAVSVGACVGFELADKSLFSSLIIIVTLALSWSFANAIFALHYAHLYYAAGKGTPHRAGLTFPDEPEPDYLDFAYFAYTLGMTFQTSDVEITARHMRRVALVHSLLGFVFNLGILALSINLIASRLG